MSDDGEEVEMDEVGATPTDFFDHEPTKQEKLEVSVLCKIKLDDGTLRVSYHELAIKKLLQFQANQVAVENQY